MPFSRKLFGSSLVKLKYELYNLSIAQAPNILLRSRQWPSSMAWTSGWWSDPRREERYGGHPGRILSLSPRLSWGSSLSHTRPTLGKTMLLLKVRTPKPRSWGSDFSLSVTWDLSPFMMVLCKYWAFLICNLSQFAPWVVVRINGEGNHKSSWQSKRYSIA